MKVILNAIVVYTARAPEAQLSPLKFVLPTTCSIYKHQSIAFMAKHVQSVILLAAAALLVPLSLCQQFDGAVFSYETLSLSDNCFAAVNTTVSSCPAWLAFYTDLW